MNIGRPPPKFPPGPPPAVMEMIRARLSEREVQGLEALFTLRATARKVDNTITEWMAGTAGSPARYQILMQLWAAKGDGIPHKDIGASMGVTRATISGLMSALEREGFVRSHLDREDRRKLIARLTTKGEAVIKKSFETNLAQFREVFASFSSPELTSLTTVLHRLRENFTIPSRRRS